MQQRRQQAGDSGIAAHDGLQIVAGRCDQFRRLAKGVAGKGGEARPLGGVAGKPAPDQIGQGRRKPGMRENSLGKRLAEQRIGRNRTLRLVAYRVPEAIIRRGHGCRHYRLRCPDACFASRI